MNKRAFTLIELLVVIAIIAILAAILFPVFAQAKAAAKKAQTLSNTKNIGTAMMIYTSDYDDCMPALQIYVANSTGPCGRQIKWQDAVYPYIKNGRGATGTGLTNANEGSGNYDEGIFKSPGGAKQSGSNYAVHQDVFMDHFITPWDGCNPNRTDDYARDYRTFSQTQFENIADKVMMVERGNSGGEWGFLQFSAWQWDWDNWGYNRTTGTLGGDNEGDVRRTTGRDCDGGFTSSGDTWANCSMFPRYRYSLQTPFLFFDGHAKTMGRSASTGASASSQVNWAKHIIVLEAVRPSWSSWYPY